MESRVAWVRDFAVRYKSQVAIQVPDFTVNSGEIVALIGPNGGGKSSLVRGLVSLADWTGEGAVFDEPLRASGLSIATKSKMGVTFQGRGLHGHWRVRDMLDLVRVVFRGQGDIDALARRLGILDLSKRRIMDLSGGERQLLEIVMALGHEPDFLIADEPSAQLDAAHRTEVRSVIAQSARRGAGVLWITHDAAELEIADRVYACQDGVCGYQGTIAEIGKRTFGDWIVDAQGDSEIIRRWGERFAAISQTCAVSHGKGRFSGGQSVRQLASEMMTEEAIASVQVRAVDAEHILMHFAKKTSADDREPHAT